MIRVLPAAAAVLLGVYLLWLFLIFPRTGARKKYDAFLGQIYAHRGVFNNTTVPENSLAAYQAAVDRGVGIELDIHRTIDGEVVVFHDNTLKRMCGCGDRPEDMCLADLREHVLLGTEEKIPTLREVLALVHGQVPLIIELKGESTDTSLCDLAMPILENYNGAYCIESFNPFLVARYRKLAPHVMRGVLVTHFRKDGDKRGFLGWILQNQLLNCAARPDFIASRYPYGRSLPVRSCRAFGAATFAWTIRERSEYDAAKANFDAFICENIDELLEK